MMREDDARRVAMAVAAWAESPEGRRALAEAEALIRRECARLAEARRVPAEAWNDPVTI